MEPRAEEREVFGLGERLRLQGQGNQGKESLEKGKVNWSVYGQYAKASNLLLL